MKRKIVKLGTSTLVVSLPSTWAKKLHLQQGDELEVAEQGVQLLFSPLSSQHVEKVNLDFSNIDALLKRLTVAQYLKGVDEITVKFNTKDKGKLVHARVNDLLGVTIVNQGKDFLVVKDLGGASEQDIQVVLQRIFLLLTNMLQESLVALEKEDTGLDFIAELESSVNKYADLAFRLINKNLPLGAPSLYGVVDYAENVADGLEELLKFISEFHFHFSKEHLEIYRGLLDWLKAFQDFFFVYSPNKAIALAKKRDKLLSIIESLKRSCSSVVEMEVLMCLETILDSMIRMFGHTLTLHS